MVFRRSRESKVASCDSMEIVGQSKQMREREQL